MATIVAPSSSERRVESELLAIGQGSGITLSRQSRQGVREAKRVSESGVSQAVLVQRRDAPAIRGLCSQ